MCLMASFPCLGATRKQVPPPPSPTTEPQSHHHNVVAAARTFSFQELAAVTRSFRDEYLVAGTESCLYKGHLKSVNQVVVMKLQHLVDRDDGVSAEQRNSEFLAHVLMLNPLRHLNLFGLTGFCADGNHRVLVHHHMPLGSLEDHLHDPSPDKARLNWSTRMNIAAGVARGLKYLHDKGVVYRTIASSDILLGDGNHPMLSQYGLAELGQPVLVGEANFDGRAVGISNSIVGTLAPETIATGTSSVASNVFSFGVMLLELITGRRAFSPQAAKEDRILVNWVRPLLQDSAERRRFRMADPALQGRYPSLHLEEALRVASMCIKQNPEMRPCIGAVPTALAHLQPIKLKNHTRTYPRKETIS